MWSHENLFQVAPFILIIYPMKQDTPKYEVGAQAFESWNNETPGYNGGYIMYTLGTITSMRYNVPADTWEYEIDIKEKGKEWKSEDCVSVLYGVDKHLQPL